MILMCMKLNDVGYREVNNCPCMCDTKQEVLLLVSKRIISDFIAMNTDSVP